MTTVLQRLGRLPARVLATSGRGRAAALVVVLLLAAVVVARPADRQVDLAADFVSTVGVYEGSEVRLMGVPIGRVTSLEPRGALVRVRMRYDASYRLPADARAVIVSPSVVADRFVQLTPAYDGTGAVLADGALVPQSRTRVPVELDRIFRTAHDLCAALGPQGANDDGSVNRFLRVGAENLRGNGKELNRLVRELAGASGVLGEGSDDFFASVASLEKLTATLAAGDADVRAFNARMADVVGFLADERTSLGKVVGDLASSFRTIERFVRTNRALLVKNVDGLAQVSRVLVKEKAALEQIIHRTPVALDNLNRAWDPRLQAVRTRSNELELLRNLDDTICDLVVNNGVPRADLVCEALTALFGGAR